MLFFVSFSYPIAFLAEVCYTSQMSLIEQGNPERNLSPEAHKQLNDAKELDRSYALSDSLGITTKKDRDLVTFLMARSSIRHDLRKHQFSSNYFQYFHAEEEVNELIAAAHASYPEGENRQSRIQNAVNSILVQVDNDKKITGSKRKLVKELATDWVKNHGSLAHEDELDISSSTSRYGFAKKGYYPLHVEETGEAAVRLRLHLPPYVDVSDLKGNYRRLQRMMRLGGLKSLVIESEEGNVSTPDTRVPTFTSERKQREGFPPRTIATKWADARIVVNVAEIEKQLKEKEQHESPQAWAKALDQAIKAGVAKEGSQQVTRDGTGLDYLYIGMATGIAASNGFPHPTPGKIAFSFIINNLMYNIVKRIGYAKTKFAKREFRWSLSSGQQFDRALLLKAMAKAKHGNVIKLVSQPHTQEKLN